MKITPQDIHHKEFKRALRGYNEEEVDVFLDQIADQFEKLYKQNGNLEDELHQLKEKLTTYQNMELTLQNTLLTAQKSAEEVQMSAKKEADLVLNNAKSEAMDTLGKSEKQRQVLNESITKLKSLEGDLKARIKASLNGFAQRLDRIEADEDQLIKEIEQQFAKMPEIEIPKVEKRVPATSEPPKQASKKEKITVATVGQTAQSVEPADKADASKSDIASEAEIDKFLHQEQQQVSENVEEPEGKKASFLGRIFKRGEEPADNGDKNDVKVKVKAKASNKKPKAKKAKKSKKKNTEEIEA